MKLITSSSNAQNDDGFVERKRAGEDNAAWLDKHVATHNRGADTLLVLLLGGVDALHFRLRVAQSNARHDLTPSHWSHVGLLLPDADHAGQNPIDWPLLEIPIDAAEGFDQLVAGNGVRQRPLRVYESARAFPNIAVVALPIGSDAAAAARRAFERGRAHLDALALMVRWLEYLWGVGSASNPLLGEVGLPSAAFVEAVTAHVGIDLTPNLAGHASCPEAIWQSARWWRDYPRKADAIRVLDGAWHVGHRLL